MPARPVRILALAAALLAFAERSVRAQTPAERPHAPILTLAPWAEDLWLALTDRDGAYFGRIAEQGTFQRFNPLMDSEYELDLRTGLFAAEEDARWASADRGLRVAGASINHPFILNAADWRERVPITDRVHLLARFRRQRSLTAQRDYPTVGLSWSRALGKPWTVGAGMGMHFFKSSADVEVTIARRWALRRGGFALDVRLALLDAFTNVVFDALGVEPPETPTHFSYVTPPVAARVAATWSAPRGRFELHAGSSNRSAVEVSFPASGDPSYVQEERVGFAGALAEWSAARGVVLAVYATTARAGTERRFPTAATDGFRLSERTHGLGFGSVATLREPVGLELTLGGAWRPEDRDRDDGTMVRHRDRESWGQLALTRRPAVGWTWRLGWAFDDRDAGVLAAQLSRTNHRLPMEFGYRFRTGFDLTVGLRWDLDQGTAAPFDGGHVRFAARW